MGIFGAYDVRGVYPKDINPHFAEKIGLTFPDVVSTKKFLLDMMQEKVLLNFSML